MGLRSLSEELDGILREARGSATGTGCRGCGGSLREAISLLAEESGMDPNALMEAMKCDEACQDKYKDKDGTFKGAKDKASESCIEMFQKCCTGVKDPEALCAFIAKKSGYGFADT